MAVINNEHDILDVRDIITRYEELSDGHAKLFGKASKDYWLTDDGIEQISLSKLLAELAGNTGDEQWHGDWYPVTLIRHDYFKTYTQDFAKAVRELQLDYTNADFDGVTYWYR